MYPNQYCNPCNEPEPCVPAPPPPDCVGEPCEEIVLDTCVRYTGPAIPCLGIETGVSLNSILQIIAERLCDCCDGTPPVIDCEVSEWSEWSECIDGVETRTRTVIQAPQNGGAECPPLIETRECCTPVNCVVSEWGPWSDCVDGVKTRTRTVTTPASCGGTPCPVLEETIECSSCSPISNISGSSSECETLQFSFLDDGTAISLFAELVSVASPTVVLQSYTFTASSSPASYTHTFTGIAAGSYLVKVYKNSAFGECDIVTTSAVTVAVCPICTPLTDIVVESDNCETFFVSFEDDGSATVLYAELFKTTAPTIVVSTKNWNPLGSTAIYSHTFTGLTTAGDYFVKIYKDAGTVKCDNVLTTVVAVPGCPINCVTSEWSEWSECIEGTETRTRTIITPAANGGVECPTLTETRDCELTVDCVVSEWSEWSDCVEGNQTRTRTVITPASNGGAPCPLLEENQPCDIPCPPPTDLTATISE